MQDATVAEQVERAFADRADDIDDIDDIDGISGTGAGAPPTPGDGTDDAIDDAIDDDDDAGAGDAPEPGGASPAAPASSGAGFFDLPESHQPPESPKRRRKGWGRR